MQLWFFLDNAGDGNKQQNNIMVKGLKVGGTFTKEIEPPCANIIRRKAVCTEFNPQTF